MRRRASQRLAPEGIITGSGAGPAFALIVADAAFTAPHETHQFVRRHSSGCIPALRRHQHFRVMAEPCFAWTAATLTRRELMSPGLLRRPSPYKSASARLHPRAFGMGGGSLRGLKGGGISWCGSKRKWGRWSAHSCRRFTCLLLTQSAHRRSDKTLRQHDWLSRASFLISHHYWSFVARFAKEPSR